MGKLLWTEPQITEIEIKMTEDNKVGLKADQYSPATNNLVVGDLKPNGNCCCS